MKNNKRNQVAGITSGLVSLLPVIILGLGGVMLYRWIKNGGGISNLLGSILGVDKSGTEVSKQTSSEAITQINKVLATKKITPNALHTSWANSIFDLMNEVSPTLLGSIITQSAQNKIYEIYNGVSYTADDALVYVQYGVRTCRNRQSTWLGFLWDDTSGDLRQHVSRYMDGANRTKMLALIDKAVKVYLV